jgi:hypothetical protein
MWPTYCVFFAQVVSLVVESLLGVHVLSHVAVGVAVHLDAVGRGGDAMVLVVGLVGCLGEDGRGGLAELGYAVVEEAVVWLRHCMGTQTPVRPLGSRGAIAEILGNLRGEVVLEVLDVERLGQTGRRGASMTKSNAVETWQINVVKMVKVDEVGKVLVG